MMEKVVVPKYVAEFIEVEDRENDLEGIVRDYNFFLTSLDNLTSEHLEAIKWYVENPYEFIRAWVEGYDLEEEKEYVWRKKKEHLASFEEHMYLYLAKPYLGTTKNIAPHQRYSESEVKKWLVVDDFKLFEKVED